MVPLIRCMFDCLSEFLCCSPISREGSVTVWGWNGSSGSGFRFRRFLGKNSFSVFQHSLSGKARFRFWFQFLEIGSDVSGSAFGFGKDGSDGNGRFGLFVPVRFLSHAA